MPFKNPHPLYSIWMGMKYRCSNPRFKQWKDYGERGITVCDRWKHSFSSFVADIGPRPTGYVIDRIDNDGNYKPENCRWASKTDSQRNQRITRIVIRDGHSYLAVELAERSGLKTDTIMRRADKGCTLEEILSKDRVFDVSGLSLGGLASGAKQRAKTHCPKGHAYSAENTYTRNNGWRKCRACRRKPR